MGMNVGGSVFFPAHPIVHVFSFLAFVFLVVVAHIGWRKTHDKAWLFIFVAFVIPLVASVTYVSYCFAYRAGIATIPDNLVVLIGSDEILAHPERHDHLADVRSVLDAGSSLLMVGLFMMASLAGLRRRKKADDRLRRIGG